LKEDSSKELKEATEFTKQMLSTPPNGQLNDQTTMLHIMNGIFNGCVFYDPNKHPGMLDSSCVMHEMFSKKPLVLQLEDLTGLVDGNNEDNRETDEKESARIVCEMKASIQLDKKHPVLDTVQEKLARVHQVKKECIKITDVFLGSCCFKYTIDDLEDKTVNDLVNEDTNKKLLAEFPKYKDLKVHPLFFRSSFSVNMFDQRGYKDFANDSGSFEVGPTGLKKTYQQPTGWTRYGLNVLGKYGGDDKWLHPFGDEGNWWRAYHGTGRAKAEGFTSLDAMSSIYNTKFRLAKVAAYGPGVYCSPEPSTYSRGCDYLGCTEIELKEGKKVFEYMFQVAVKPGATTLTPQSSSNVWSVQNPDDIRVYGILMREKKINIFGLTVFLEVYFHFVRWMKRKLQTISFYFCKNFSSKLSRDNLHG